MMIQRLLGLPVDASVHGARMDTLMMWVHVLMAVLFVGWTLFFLYIIFRFRRSRHPKADYVGVTTHASSYIEAGVAIVEVALLVALSIPFWSWKVSAFPTDPGTVRVRVIAQQFAWNIHYPGPDGKFGRTDRKLVTDTNAIGLDRADKDAADDIITINQLHLPVNTPAILELTTKDVIHSLFIPVMRVKQDTMPGMSIPIHFTPTLTSDALREQQAVTITLPATKPVNWDLYVAMDEHKDKDGKIIARKLGRTKTGTVIPLSTKAVEQLVAAGVTELRIGPAYPMEIACAQLCGLNHYRMKGFLTVSSTAGYQAWIKAQLEELEEE